MPFSTRFNGTYIAEAQRVVVVSVNYRLGIFGFLGAKELAQRGGSGAGTGNYGIQDQRAAMAWVQQHIAAFGGDKARVMIHGCSAGGVSSPSRVSVCVARTLNVTGDESRDTLSLQKEHLRVVCGPCRGEKGA